jgi:AP endonuclease 2
MLFYFDILPHYDRWNTMKTHDDILNHLEADIICFQGVSLYPSGFMISRKILLRLEVKSSRSALPKPVALPPSYSAFFSFPVRKSGYSGVATYTRNSTIVPLKAEEGLCGLLEPKPLFSPEERVSDLSAYPQQILRHEELSKPSQRVEEEHEPWIEPDYKDLDSEGRALVLDFGLFVLINVYCPNDGNGTEERDRYKADFHRVLRARIQGLVDKERREVVLVGDINACAAVVDHCEGHLMVAKGIAEGMSGEEGFWGKNARRWMRDLLVDEAEGRRAKGYVVDITRRLHPDRKGMYTCTWRDAFLSLSSSHFWFIIRTGWNTKISARDSNYGTRIDYILITPGLLPWVKGADIQPQIKGSDHCPVYLDLLDEIPDPSQEGISIKLQDVLGVKPSLDGQRNPPRIASKFWSEHSGKQMLLMKFFGKKCDDEDPALQTPGSSSNTLSIPRLPKISPPTTAILYKSAPAAPPTKDISNLQADLQLCPDALKDPAASSDSNTAIVTGPSSTSIQTTITSSQSQGEFDPQLQLHPPSLKSRPSAVPKIISSSAVKRKSTADTLSRSSASSKRQKQPQKSQAQGQGPGQTKLSTFFGNPSSPTSSSSNRKSKSKSSSKSISREPEPESDHDTESQTSLTAVSNTTSASEDPQPIDVDIDAEQCYAIPSQERTQAQDVGFSFSQVNGNGNGNSTSKHVWSALLAPTPAPKCTVHGEPAKELTVTKQGPNRGKRFFICAR